MYLEDTWFKRDLPTLKAIAKIKDEDPFAFPNVDAIQDLTDLSKIDILRSIKALEDVFIKVQHLSGSDGFGFIVLEIYPSAREATGLWPSPEKLVSKLIESIEKAAVSESNLEKKTKLQNLATLGREFAQDLIVGVATEFISRKI